MDKLLAVNNLQVAFGEGSARKLVVDDVSFHIGAKETLVLVGESGSGKSITALSLMRLLPVGAHWLSGSVLLNDIAINKIAERDMRQIRGGRMAMIFQEPQSALNPVLTAGQQIAEAVVCHQQLSGKACRNRGIELLDAVGIPEPQRRFDDYPHQFSGGMKQRIMIAMALAGSPDLLIADEPTTALDVTIQAQILELLRDLQKQTNMSMLFITHDLGVAAQMADRIAVMKTGKILEQNAGKIFFAHPKHAYSKALFAAIPSWQKRVRTPAIANTGNPLLSVCDLKIHYPIRKGIFKRIVAYIHAVDGISLSVYPGQTVAIVGESGSGKTTLGKGILKLLPCRGGRVLFAGEDLLTLSDNMLRRRRRDIQFIFQDPFSSMNPRMRVEEIIAEGLIAHKLIKSARAAHARIDELLLQVGLLTEHKARYPHEFSGGQRQRISIARALALEPKLIICDEPTSALDVSVQADILALLKSLQQRLNLAYLFITHNIAVVEYIADEVIVMHHGKVVEQGYAEQVLFHPQHEYTQKLLATVPRVPVSVSV